MVAQTQKKNKIMSRFMMTLANAVANHVKEGNISIYKNTAIEKSKTKFQECLSRCSGMKFDGLTPKDFASDKVLILRFLNDVSHNRNKSFNDMIFVITTIANHEE